MLSNTKGVAAIVVSAGLAVSAASAGVVPASVLVAEGDALDGSVVSSVNSPFTNGPGEPGLVIPLSDGRRAIWIGTGEVFTSDDALPDDLSGGEATMGIGDNGEFIYSPSFNGFDAVYGESGLILRDETPAPDFTPGFNTTFHSRPRMINDGSSYWVAGTNDGMGGTSSQNRIIYFRDGATGTITGVLRAGEVFDGVTVAGFGGIDFDVAYSDNGDHNMFLFDNAFNGNAQLAVSGTIVAAEASPASDGLDNWDNFDVTDINNSGEYVFSGDTDGSTSTDEFIAYNGAIALREGGSLPGGTLAGSVDALSINDNGEIVYIWEINAGAGANEALFYAASGAELSSSQVLLALGDQIDVNKDGLADFTVTDFNASTATGPGLDLAENGKVYVEVDLQDNDLVTREAIIALDLPGAGGCNAADIAEPFGVLDLGDVNAFVGGFGSNPAADLNGDGIWDLDDVQAFVAAFVAGCP